MVWKGKDEQDQKGLEVPALPIYIQEKIHPKALIEDLRRQAKKEKPEDQIDLFGDFNGIAFQDLVDFYSHKDGVNWSNRMILGDSLLVMASLAEKEGLKGKVQMIYMDPPYGIKFGSNWQVSTRKRDVKDGRAEEVTRQPEQIKAFRDTWELGIHSYLFYLRDRLVLARELLTETGSVFVQIGDENVHLVRCLMDEVLGSENFISLISFATTSGFQTKEIARGGDYLLWYGRNRDIGTKARLLFEGMSKEAGEAGYRYLLFPDGSSRVMTVEEMNRDVPIPKDSIPYKPDNILSQGAAKEDQPFTYEGKTYRPGINSHWKASYPDGMSRLSWARRIHVSQNTLQYRRMSTDFPFRVRNNVWVDTLTGQFTEDKVYAVQTNTKVVERCLLMTTDPGDLVLDPTCGSGTTAFVAEQWGRRWITIDTSRVAIAIARTRLMAARYPYYILSDSPQGIEKEAELIGQPVAPHKTEQDVRKGFVYRRVPHVTLRSIANNPDIQEGMSREDIDAAIVQHSDTELLHDQPYEDSKRVRVSGPFTVESLSPHRVLEPRAQDGCPEPANPEDPKNGQFVRIILDNLRKAGVQNTIRGERLKFECLEPHPGVYLHAVGDYKEKDSPRRAAICIGPEHGTVGPELLKEAAKEAMKGVGFDLLVVCGFAFDPHVTEEARQYGNLTVLLSRMNPDLMIGDELLKKTGAGNLFMVFGEPDVQIERRRDDKIVVTIRGLDIYDPTTGQIRSHSTEDIACWFVDTEYNEESFFVRHAYFCGSKEPFERLKKALKAEISATTWGSLHATKSRPFAAPERGRIAIKVINHYGDEVLKVYDVRD